MILKQLKERHMKELMTNTEVYQSGLLAMTYWKHLLYMMGNWRIGKKSLSTIIKLLIHRIPDNHIHAIPAIKNLMKST